MAPMMAMARKTAQKDLSKHRTFPSHPTVEDLGAVGRLANQGAFFALSILIDFKLFKRPIADNIFGVAEV